MTTIYKQQSHKKSLEVNQSIQSFIEWKNVRMTGSLTFALADSTSADPADAAFNSATAAWQHMRRLEEEIYKWVGYLWCVDYEMYWCSLWNYILCYDEVLRHTVHHNSIQYTVHSIQHTVYSTQYTVYSIQYTVYCIQYTVYSTQHTVHSIQYTAYNIQYTVHSIQYTVHSIQHIVYTIQCAIIPSSMQLPQRQSR